MMKWLHRFVALLQVLALVADPATAYALSQKSIAGRSNTVTSDRFNEEALSLRAIDALQDIFGRHTVQNTTAELFRRKYPGLHALRTGFLWGQVSFVIQYVFTRLADVAGHPAIVKVLHLESVPNSVYIQALVLTIVIEEFFCRGLILECLRKVFNIRQRFQMHLIKNSHLKPAPGMSQWQRAIPVLANILQACIFGIIHLRNLEKITLVSSLFYVIPKVISGMMYGALYYQGGLFGSFVAHGMHDLFPEAYRQHILVGVIAVVLFADVALFILSLVMVRPGTPCVNAPRTDPQGQGGNMSRGMDEGRMAQILNRSKPVENEDHVKLAILWDLAHHMKLELPRDYMGSPTRAAAWIIRQLGTIQGLQFSVPYNPKLTGAHVISEALSHFASTPLKTFSVAGTPRAIQAPDIYFLGRGIPFMALEVVQELVTSKDKSKLAWGAQHWNANSGTYLLEDFFDDSSPLAAHRTQAVFHEMLEAVTPQSESLHRYLIDHIQSRFFDTQAMGRDVRAFINSEGAAAPPTNLSGGSMKADPGSLGESLAIFIEDVITDDGLYMTTAHLKHLRIQKGLAPASVRTHISDLCSIGVLVRERQSDAKPFHYRLNPDVRQRLADHPGLFNQLLRTRALCNLSLRNVELSRIVLYKKEVRRALFLQDLSLPGSTPGSSPPIWDARKIILGIRKDEEFNNAGDTLKYSGGEQTPQLVGWRELEGYTWQYALEAYGGDTLRIWMMKHSGAQAAIEVRFRGSSAELRDGASNDLFSDRDWATFTGERPFRGFRKADNGQLVAFVVSPECYKWLNEEIENRTSRAPDVFSPTYEPEQTPPSDLNQGSPMAQKPISTIVQESLGDDQKKIEHYISNVAPYRETRDYIFFKIILPMMIAELLIFNGYSLMHHAWTLAPAVIEWALSGSFLVGLVQVFRSARQFSQDHKMVYKVIHRRIQTVEATAADKLYLYRRALLYGSLVPVFFIAGPCYLVANSFLSIFPMPAYPMGMIVFGCLLLSFLWPLMLHESDNLGGINARKSELERTGRPFSAKPFEESPPLGTRPPALGKSSRREFLATLGIGLLQAGPIPDRADLDAFFRDAGVMAVLQDATRLAAMTHDRFQPAQIEEAKRWLDRHEVTIESPDLEDPLYNLNLLVLRWALDPMPLDRFRGLHVILSQARTVGYLPYGQRDLWLVSDPDTLTFHIATGLHDFAISVRPGEDAGRFIRKMMAHEIAHRWDYLQIPDSIRRQYYAISWDPDRISALRSETMEPDKPRGDADLSRDFVPVAGGTTINYKTPRWSDEDLANVVSGISTPEQNAVEVNRAIAYLHQGRPHLADKIAFGYGFWGKIPYPEGPWIVRTDKGPWNNPYGTYVYLDREGNRVKIEFSPQGHIETPMPSSRIFDPNLFVWQSPGTPPEWHDWVPSGLIALAIGTGLYSRHLLQSRHQETFREAMAPKRDNPEGDAGLFRADTVATLLALMAASWYAPGRLALHQAFTDILIHMAALVMFLVVTSSIVRWVILKINWRNKAGSVLAYFSKSSFGDSTSNNSKLSLTMMFIKISAFEVFSKGLMLVLLVKGLTDYRNKRRVSIDAIQVPSDYPGFLNERMFSRLAWISHANLLLYVALIAIVRAFGYGHLDGILGVLGLYGAMQYATIEANLADLVEKIKKPAQILRFADEKISLFGVKPEDLKIKAIGFEWSWRNWRYEYVLWLDEPYYLRWAGLLAPIAIYIAPIENWVKASDLFLRWGNTLVSTIKPSPTSAPGRTHRIDQDAA